MVFHVFIVVAVASNQPKIMIIVKESDSGNVFAANKGLQESLGAC